MVTNKNVDLLLGNPRRALVMIAIPIMVALFVSEINSAVDRAWCSGLGPDALAAVSVVRPIYNVLAGLGTGLGVGASAVISRHLGAGRDDAATTTCTQTIMLALIVGAILIPILVLAQPTLLSLMGAGDVKDECMAYMTPYSLLVVAIISNGAICGILNGQGASKCYSVMMGSLAVSNMLLDPVFIYLFDMGISGASFATMLATGVSISMGLFFIRGKRTYINITRKEMRWDREQSRAVISAGGPQMLEYSVLYGMDIVLNYIVIICAGTNGLTVFSTADCLILLMMVPAMAVGSALVPVASSAYGQKNLPRLNKSFWFAIIMGICLVMVTMGLLEIFPEQFLYLFTYSKDMVMFRPQMVHLLTFMCISIPLLSFTFICSGYLQAVKHPTYSVVMAVVRNLILIVFFLIASSHSLDAIGWAFVSGQFVGMSLMCTLVFFTSRRVEREMNSC